MSAAGAKKVLVATATTTKVCTPAGAKVLTVATSVVATCEAPSAVTVVINAGNKAGISFNGCIVSKVNAGSLAEQSGVKVGWSISEVAGHEVTGAQVNDALQAARTGGDDYSLLFTLPRQQGREQAAKTPTTRLPAKLSAQEKQGGASKGQTQAKRGEAKVGAGSKTQGPTKGATMVGPKAGRGPVLAESKGSEDRGSGDGQANGASGNDGGGEVVPSQPKETTTVEAPSLVVVPVVAAQSGLPSGGPTIPADSSTDEDGEGAKVPNAAEDADDCPCIDGIVGGGGGGGGGGSSTAAEDEAVVQKAAAAQAAAAEYARLADGEVCLKYEMYDEKFPIKAHSLTSAEIDDVYCLSFVMPGCRLFLSSESPTQKLALQAEGTFVPFVDEQPVGTFRGLLAGGTYWVHVSQNPEQLLKDQAGMKAKMQGPADKAKLEKNDGRGFESCSCVYGNPCIDEYGCKDWYNRYAVAKANGWKGFS